MFVSVDSVDASLKAQETYDVPFPLLSDSDAKVHEAYSVVNALEPAQVEKLKKYELDIEAWSGRKHHKIAIPSIFLIDQDSTVRFAHAAHDYKTRPDEDALLAKLELLVK